MQEKASGMRAWLSDRIGRRPLFATAMVAMAGVLAAEGGLWVAVAVVLVAGLFGSPSAMPPRAFEQGPKSPFMRSSNQGNSNHG